VTLPCLLVCLLFFTVLAFQSLARLFVALALSVASKRMFKKKELINV
jgi:hypothetical protein